MRKLRLASVVAGLLGIFVPAVLGAVVESPRVVAPESSRDFGTVRQGTKLAHTFVLRNEGAAPLTIAGVEPTAHGMTVRFGKVVPPGGTGRVTVEWDTTGVKGVLKGEVVVKLDEPTYPPVRLTLTAIVKPAIELIPFAAVFFSVFRDESAERSVTVVNHEQHPLRVTRLEREGEHFRAALEPVEIGREYKLVVTVPAGMPAGRYLEAVYLHTDHPSHAPVKVGVNVFVKSDLYVNPETVDFGTVRLDHLARAPRLLALLKQTFLVKKRRGEFEIKTIESDIPYLEITQSPVGSGGTFRIDVGLARDRLRAGPISGSIRIVTSDRDFPELTVPVRGAVQ